MWSGVGLNASEARGVNRLKRALPRKSVAAAPSWTPLPPKNLVGPLRKFALKTWLSRVSQV